MGNGELKTDAATEGKQSCLTTELQLSKAKNSQITSTLTQPTQHNIKLRRQHQKPLKYYIITSKEPELSAINECNLKLECHSINQSTIIQDLSKVWLHISLLEDQIYIMMSLILWLWLAAMLVMRISGVLYKKYCKLYINCLSLKGKWEQLNTLK